MRTHVMVMDAQRFMAALIGMVTPAASCPSSTR